MDTTSILTEGAGLYPIEHGVRQYGGHYDQSKPNALKVLGEAGYRRAIWGKDHCFKGNVIGSLYDEGEDICIGIMGQNPNYINAWDSAELPIDSQWNLTKRLTDKGIDFIKRHASKEEPFFLTLNYQDPHPFFTCPAPYNGLFDASNFELPMNYRNTPVNDEIRRLTHWRIHSGEVDMPTDELKQAMAMYCGQIRYVDDQVGRILGVLKGLEILEHTIILFWSDHGEFMGDYGVTHKIPAFYECLMRVPLIIYDPTGRLPKGQCNHLVELMDGMATILDLCGLDQPQGSHAMPQTRENCIRDDIYADAGMLLKQPKHPIADLRIKGATAPTPYGPGSMLRNSEWKLCVYADDQGELYSLRQDPYETRNLFNEPNYNTIKNTMMARLTQRMMCLGQMPERLPQGDL